MRAIIKASSVISPQHTFYGEGFPNQINAPVSNVLSCIEPDYRSLINPIQLRRMPRILKMGLAAARQSVIDAGEIHPDAIIVGTGLGCLDNLEKFLMEVIEKQEHITSVLPFINSTHNAVAAQIAMLLNNHSYNITYCHRAFSFESALQDAMMHIHTHQAGNILVGGIDECTPDFIKLQGYQGAWRDPGCTLDLFNHNSQGTIAGEGAAFFIVSAASDEDAAHNATVEDLHSFYSPEPLGFAEVTQEIEGFLDTQQVKLKDIDCVIMGMNGDDLNDQIYKQLQNDFFPCEMAHVRYKHLCGEYYTSSAFALWLGAFIINSQHIPSVASFGGNQEGKFRKLLFFNHSRNREHSLILLTHG
jgi:3-oxoacyl-(acyl-carrier-protein) synthase